MKKELLILGVVIVSLVAYLVFHSEQKSNYTLPDLSRVAVEEVSTLAVEKNGKTINLYRANGQWTVSDKHYPADTDTVKKLLDVVENLSVSALVSQSRDLRRYDLTPEQGIKVTAKKGDAVVRSFEIGKTAPTNRHTFVTLAGHEGVYHALGDFRRDYDRDVEGFRSKRVFGFDRESLVSLVVEKGDVKRTILAGQPDGKDKDQDQDQATWKAEDGNAVDAGKVDALVADLTHLDCASYMDGQTGTPDDGGTSLLKIQVTTGSGDGAKNVDLVLHGKTENGDYRAASSQTPYSFILNAYQGDDLVSWVDAVLGIKHEGKKTEDK
ncbi:hypothetical protein HRM2_32580 [Desulforapulum autotrophicum HRM2]|uniref:DUF4340 domain-containing protein n=1 Tax=Desulforapulum autotrophicum (strain ATCC 43914 / DSM 3382 / VKM B-1955 / HRM2) TaxID=177437 RepID=C0QLN3_DESAH|nr:DUF4340 domain-containing protein [Desulforapulum autotrophicum]ACN16337.1 hypothetical protein HRM2_32580 [Desulforapulum autotrophicum HRM2]